MTQEQAVRLRDAAKAVDEAFRGLAKAKQTLGDLLLEVNLRQSYWSWDTVAILYRAERELAALEGGPE